MHNVMLDLETMGNGPRAAIVSIGAVFFDPLTGKLGAEFEAHVDLCDSAKFGEIDPDTVLWWLRQNDEARAGVTEGDRLPLCGALYNLCRWVDTNSPSHSVMMWGNGAAFDNVILRSAFAATTLKAPWAHWNDRDVRTIVELGRTLCGFDPKKEMPFEGVAHTPLADAKHQARYVSAIYQRLACPVRPGFDFAPAGISKGVRHEN